MTKKIIFVVNDGWFFMLHRLPTLRAAQDIHLDVVLVTRAGDHREQIEDMGVRLIDFPFDRRQRNPVTALIQILKIAQIYRRERPDIVHHIALKPILFGSIAAFFARVPRVVNGFVGLGTLFYSDILLARALRPFLFPLLRCFAACTRVTTLFENGDDHERMLSGRMAHRDRARIVPGSGVDTTRFLPSEPPVSPPFICLFAGRMIAMKGLATLRAAFEILAQKHPKVHLWLCGTADPGNPESWTEENLREWAQSSPNVKWMGPQPDMAAVWPKAHIGVQPTVGGEGLPVAMLEAASCARAVIVTDVPGCRDVVEDGVTGKMVPPQSPHMLAEAIMAMADDPALCAAMGRAGRARVEEHFAADRVTAAIRDIYHDLLGLSGQQA